MDIERINDYNDPRFPKEVLNQHGAFVADGKYPCSFRIIGETTAETKIALLKLRDALGKEAGEER